MGLFDELENAAGIAGQGGGPPAGAIGAITQMLQSYPGGVSGIVQQFEQAGLGGVARSWVGTGQNQAVAPSQVHAALGASAIDEVAEKLGVSKGEAAGHIAQFLPLIVSHLSPGGQAPSDGLGAIGGLLRRLAGGAPS